MQNAHLWKRILNEGIRSTAGGQKDWLSNRICKAPIVVSGIVYEGKLRSSFSRGAMAFPFPEFWVEAGAVDASLGAFRLGSLVEVRRGDGTFDVTMFCCQCGDDLAPIIIGHATTVCSESETHHESPVRCWVEPGSYATFGVEESNAAIRTAAAVCTDILALLGCKNVSLAAHDNDPKQVRRAIKRHGGTPDSYRYHTLVVRPPGAKADAPAQEIGVMPRHVCRGHFAEYGPEFNKGLLFGKYAGRFYVPPHLKGDKKNGVVEKDYAVVGA